MESESESEADGSKSQRGEELKRGELVTVADGSGEQYVVLEVIQLDDGSEQHVAVVAPGEHYTLDDPTEPGEDPPCGLAIFIQYCSGCAVVTLSSLFFLYKSFLYSKITSREHNQEIY